MPAGSGVASGAGSRGSSAAGVAWATAAGAGLADAAGWEPRWQPHARRGRASADSASRRAREAERIVTIMSSSCHI